MAVTAWPSKLGPATGSHDPGDFHTTAEVTKKVPMMYQASDFSYAAADGVQVLELPYKGSELSMLIVLPVEKEGLSKLEETLTAGRVEGWAKAVKKKKVEGAKRLFVMDYVTHKKEKLLFYNPKDVTMVPASGESEILSIYAACAPWNIMSHKKVKLETVTMTVDGIVTHPNAGTYNGDIVLTVTKL